MSQDKWEAAGLALGATMLVLAVLLIASAPSDPGTWITAGFLVLVVVTHHSRRFARSGNHTPFKIETADWERPQRGHDRRFGLVLGAVCAIWVGAAIGIIHGVLGADELVTLACTWAAVPVIVVIAILHVRRRAGPN